MTTPELALRPGALGEARLRGSAFAHLLRLHNARIPLAVFLLAGAGGRTGHLVGGATLVLASYGLAAAYNDLHDVEIDRANGRDRPLATGALLPADARVAMAACGAVAVVVQLVLDQPRGLVVTLAALAAGSAYSHPGVGLERRGLVGTAVLSWSYFVAPVLLAGPPSSPVLLGALVVGGTATLLYKDVKDEAGDRRHGKRTPLVRWGMGRMEAVAVVLGAAAVVAGAATAGWGWWTAAQSGALGAQLAMAVTGASNGRLLTAHRLLAVGGLAGLGAA